MTYDGKGGAKSGRRRLRPWHLSVFLAVVLLISALGASAQAQDATGTAKLGNSLQYGNTSYSVKCTYPSTAVVGSDLVITVTLHVDSLTGLVAYITNYGLVAQVFVGSQVLQGSALSTANATFLYPGSSWWAVQHNHPAYGEQHGPGQPGRLCERHAGHRAARQRVLQRPAAERLRDGTRDARGGGEPVDSEPLYLD